MGFVAGSIFSDGIYVLEHYAYAKKIPKDERLSSALAKLLKFIKEDDHAVLWDDQGLEKEKEAKKEQSYAVRIAQHLLTRLTANSTFTIDEMYGPLMACTCKAHENLMGKVGYTSYGCTKAWMGNADRSLDARKPVFGVSDQVRHKPACTSSETG